MFNMSIEPKMQSQESCACDAHVKYVTEACAPKPPLGLGVGKQGRCSSVVLPGAGGGGGGNRHSENTSPEYREEARAGHLGKQQAKNNAALRKHARAKPSGSWS